MDIQRAAKQVGKAKHVIDLIGVIRTPRGNDGILAYRVGLFRCDFRIGVGHGKDNRIFGHVRDHFLCHSPLHRNAQKHIGAVHGFVQCAQIGVGGMGRFPLVHALFAALIDHAFGVTQQTVVMLRTHGFDQLDTGDTGRTGPVHHDTTILDLFARQVQRVDQTGGANHCRTVLVIVENRNVHFLFQTLLDDKTFRRFDILKVNPAKGRPHQTDRIDNFVGVFGIQLDIDRIHIGKAFEQNCLALHHRFRCQRTQIAHTQNG